MPLVNIFDSPGDVLSTVLIWLLGAVISYRLGRILGLTTERVFFLFLWHSLLSVAFTYLTHVDGADAVNYYLSALNGEITWAIGTPAISVLAYLPAYGFNLSYIGANLLFSIFSMIGLLLIDAVLQDIRYSKRQLVRWVCASLVFFPSVHFWTGAVGKDSLALLGAGLIIWALQSLKTRYVALLFGLLIFVVVRPHLAIIFMSAYSLSTVLSRGTNRFLVGSILTLFGIGLYFLVPIFLTLVGLEDAGILEVFEYTTYRQSYEIGGSAISLQDMNFLQRNFAFLFRPTVLEIRNALDAITAVENTALMISFALLIANFSIKKSLTFNAMQGRLILLIYGVAAAVVLGQLTYNLGLAARQKWMVIPFLWVALAAYSRSRNFRQRVTHASPSQTTPSAQQNL